MYVGTVFCYTMGAMPDLLSKTPEKALPIPEMKPEQPRAPETRPEAPTPLPDEREGAPPAPVSAPVKAVAAPSAADPLVKKIDKILEEDLADVYFKMSPEQQAAFKKKGEETSVKIRGLLEQASVKAKEVLKLIVAWLRLIPGVNKLFWEQEAKIKTDKIMMLKK